MAETNREKKPGTGVDATLTRHGGLSYLEIPAADVHRSAAFYEAVCGWKVEWRQPDDALFTDATGHMIGRWVAGRAAPREPGLVPYFYVDRIDDAISQAVANGGEVVKPVYAEGDIWVATVRDPAGNVIGLWQAGPR
jgi:predicted enzyme related to lactoylglutathione lyase